MARILSVEVSLENQKMSAREALEIRHALEDKIEEAGVGKIVGGGCMADGSSIDFDLATKDPEDAEALVKDLLAHADLLRYAELTWQEEEIDDEDLEEAESESQRGYIHNACENTTFVTDDTFKAVADPLPGCVSTFCSHCAKQFPVADYQWADTGENLADYYRRHQEKVSGLGKLWISRWFGLGVPAAVAIGMATLGIWLLVRGSGFLGVLVLMFGFTMLPLAAIIGWRMGCQAILKSALGVSDPRELK